MNNRIGNAVSFAFFLFLLCIGLATYRDYGVTWDEFQQRGIGGVSLKHVASIFAPSLLPDSASRLPALNDYTDRDYGVAFELPAAVLEVVLKIVDEREIYFFRHLLNFLVAFGGIAAIYLMARRRFADWRIALLAALFVVLTPRLFAESFYNSKDSVFMAVFAIAMHTTISFVVKPGIRSGLLNGLATAIAIDVRIMAIILPLAALSILIVRILKREVSVSKSIRAVAVYLATSSILVVAMWPWLWSDPVGHFAQAFQNMSNFRWRGDVLYMGRFIHGTELPWHYIPVWILITTPLLYLPLFLVGAFQTLRAIISRGIKLWNTDEELQDAFFLSLFVAPILAVIILHSVVYHGWRHLYFVYPAFILLAVRGWSVLWTREWLPRVWKPILATTAAAFSSYICIWMVQAHPFQNVYFNALAGTNLKARYDLDYFGMANRQAIEYILANDHSDVVNVTADSFTLVFASFKMIKNPDRQRLRVQEERNGPHYLFTNYYLQKNPDDSKYEDNYDLFYQIRVDDEIILSVFKSKSG